jgi:hypothetical protein
MIHKPSVKDLVSMPNCDTLCSFSNVEKENLGSRRVAFLPHSQQHPLDTVEGGEVKKIQWRIWRETSLSQASIVFRMAKGTPIRDRATELCTSKL